ncbi:hypothetical protein D3C74_390160 [compost metagenome]
MSSFAAVPMSTSARRPDFFSSGLDPTSEMPKAISMHGIEAPAIRSIGSSTTEGRLKPVSATTRPSMEPMIIGFFAVATSSASGVVRWREVVASSIAKLIGWYSASWNKMMGAAKDASPRT